MNLFGPRLILLLMSAMLLVLSACSPNTPDAVFHRALRSYQERDPIAASLYFEDFIKKFPDDERIQTAYQLLAQCYLNMRDYSHARAVFQEMKETFPDYDTQVISTFQIGNTYFSEGFFDEAVKAYSEIAGATDPTLQVQAYNQIAKVYAAQTHKASAEEYFDKIYQIADTNITDPTQSLEFKLLSLYGKAEINSASEEFDTSRSLYQKALEVVNNATGISGIELDRENALINWAHTWAFAGDFISAATTYDQLYNSPYITEQTKPRLIIWKLQSLDRLFIEDENDKYTPEEIALLVDENNRLIANFPDTEYSTNAKLTIANLVRNSTPELSQQYYKEVIETYDKTIADPPSDQKKIETMINKVRALILFEKYDEAKQEIQLIRQTYKDVPRVIQQVSGMLQFIEQKEKEKLEAAAKPDPSTVTDESSNPEP